MLRLLAPDNVTERKHEYWAAAERLCGRVQRMRGLNVRRFTLRTIKFIRPAGSAGRIHGRNQIFSGAGRWIILGMCIRCGRQHECVSVFVVELWG